MVENVTALEMLELLSTETLNSLNKTSKVALEGWRENKPWEKISSACTGSSRIGGCLFSWLRVGPARNVNINSAHAAVILETFRPYAEAEKVLLDILLFGKNCMLHIQNILVYHVFVASLDYNFILQIILDMQLSKWEKGHLT